MKTKVLHALAALALLTPSVALTADAEADLGPIVTSQEVALDDLRWIRRPLVVFADSAADPRYQEQIGLLTARLNELVDRDVLIITDTDPGTLSELRRKLRPRGFMLVLIGKDGQVKLRKPVPWDVRALSRQIDKMPLRQQEIRDAKERARSP